jgi:hypothetical protein
MRKLATVLSLLVLCVGSASAQWNLAQDPAATLIEKNIVPYDVLTTSSSYEVQLKTELKGGIQDEISIWRTGTGSTAYTVADIAVYDPTLLKMPDPAATEAQCKAAVLKGIAAGLQPRTASGVAQTKTWFSRDGVAHSMNFEIRWNSAGMATVTRLPDDVVSGTVK